MSPIRVVFLKELVDGLRDRRSLMSLLLFPLVGPLLIAFLLSQTTAQMGADGEQVLPVQGRDNAPGLVAFLDERGLAIVEAPADPLAAVSARDVELVLIIPQDYGERFREGRSARVRIISDAFRTDRPRPVAKKVKTLVNAYGAQIGTMRLLARGVSPELVQPVTVEEVDVSTSQSRAALFLNFVPMFVLLAAFIGGMFVATDTTAGERERGSLEPLLLNPVTRRALVVGKWMATVVFSSFTVVLTLAGTLLSLSRVSVAELGINSLTLAPSDIALVLVAVLPLALLASAAQMLTASFARSFREAQTYLSLMVFVPTVPAALVTVMPLDSEPWMHAIPVFGQQVLLMDVIRGDPVSLGGVLVAGITALIGTLACLQGAAALFRRETIIYGR